MENNVQPLPPSQINDDTPMDEFEYTGRKNKLGSTNILKIVKFAAMFLAVIAIVVITGTLGIKLLNSQPNATPQPTQISNSSASPTEQPQIIYPSEYYDVEKDIEEYSKSVSNVSDERSRLEIPQFKFDIAF